MTAQPNIIVIVIDDLRFDELGFTGHPYMKTPHIDRIAREGALFERRLSDDAALLAEPRVHPDRPVREPARDHRQRRRATRRSHRLPTYHARAAEPGYETAHVGKWHMGNDARRAPATTTGSASRGRAAHRSRAERERQAT